MFNKLFNQFEKLLAFILLLMIAGVAVASVIELGYILYRDITSNNGFLFEIDELFEIFGMFMLVLIAIELMSSIHTYLENKAIHIEIMFMISLTAVTRKIVILDSKSAEPLYIMGLGVLLLSLSIGYFLIKRCSIYPNKKTEDEKKCDETKVEW